MLPQGQPQQINTQPVVNTQGRQSLTTYSNYRRTCNWNCALMQMKSCFLAYLLSTALRSLIWLSELFRRPMLPSLLMSNKTAQSIRSCDLHNGSQLPACCLLQKRSTICPRPSLSRRTNSRDSCTLIPDVPRSHTHTHNYNVRTQTTTGQWNIHKPLRASSWEQGHYFCNCFLQK